jgi:hypothetical protein
LDCSTFLIMCNVPSMAVFCRESIECSPGIVSRYSFSPLVTIPVASVITGMTKHFIFYIHWMSILRFLCFNFFFSLLLYYIPIWQHCYIYQQIFFFFVINYYVWPICENLSVFLYPLIL